MKSQKISTIIIDDEVASRQTIESYINQCCPKMEIVAACQNATDGLSAILQHQPDVVFLDVQMPDFTGFELLKSLPKIDFQLIIITGYEKFALQAIKASALDFLLKPISLLDFQQTINKIEKHSLQHTEKQHQVLLQNIAVSNIQKIIVPTEEGWHIVPINEIVSCRADTVYTHILLMNKEQIISSKPLKEYELLLPKSAFVRIHKSHLIHLQFIKKYIKGRGGNVEMKDGSELPVARQRKTEFIERLQVFINQKPL
ncbi:MAG: LytR/AlgR family response regulator transcription factor [Saprospiraceae bacterium]